MYRKIAHTTILHRAKLIILGLLAVIILVGCQEVVATPQRNISASDIQVSITGPTLEPYQFRTSDKGTATAHGIMLVLDPMSLVPAPDDAIYLVPLPDAGITTVPQFEPGTVPQAEVDEASGEFMFTNLQPGQYAVVVVTKGGAQIPARFYQKDYAIITIDESQLDTIIELGNLSLP